MEIIANIDITTPRHESFPYISYNPEDEEFMVLWHTDGPMGVGCVDPTDPVCAANWHSIDGQRISRDGELLGEPIQLSPPEVVGWKDLPKSAYNAKRKSIWWLFKCQRQRLFGLRKYFGLE